MSLTIARFDLDETVPIGNVPRTPSTTKPVLPTGFPFVFDTGENEVVAPVLLFLGEKYTAPKSFKDGAWIAGHSADAAAADLKDWWAKIQIGDVPWDAADDYLVADWLIDMKTTISGKTKDFLSDSTVKRRAANVAEFYRWAFRRALVERVPEADAAKRLANLRLTDPNAARKQQPGRHRRYDHDPHPIDPSVAVPLKGALGPLPSENKDASSRTRLAFELGWNTGMRIDEILNLDVAVFDDFVFDPKRPFVMTPFEIEHTKGLVRREIMVPAWLMEEIRIYIEGERAVAVKQGRRSWLKGERIEFPNLLLNHAGATHNAGKPTQPATIQDEFHKVCMRLGITKPKVLAKGTKDRKVVRVPKHTFHDTRHSFAVLYFRSLEARGRPRPWIRVQKALGHAQVSTTTGIYLNVIDHLGSEALELVAQTFHAISNASRDSVTQAVQEETGL